jgi:anti-sigma regulatory factor (Ser/Thr protein kinase)
MMNLEKVSRSYAAEIEQLGVILELVSDTLGRIGVPKECVFKMKLAADEIFTNIANYAYPGGEPEKWAMVELGVSDGLINMTFIDGGVPFNPLAASEPDTSLGLEDRPVGGLGIFIVKSFMDEMSYSRENCRNILTVKKTVI